MNLSLVIIITLIFGVYYYYHEVYYPKIYFPKEKSKRMNIFISLINETFNTNFNENYSKLKFEFKKYNILVEYKCEHSHRFLRVNDYSNYYIEMPKLEDNLIALCRIHFETTKFGDTYYLRVPNIIGLRFSINSLVNGYDKKIEEFILRYENYVEEKRMSEIKR